VGGNGDSRGNLNWGKNPKLDGDELLGGKNLSELRMKGEVIG